MSEQTTRDGYAVRRFRDRDLPAFLDLYEAVFDVPRSAAWFEWKYVQNPYVDEVPLFVAEHDGDAVGFRGFLVLPMRAGGETHLAAQPTDTMVHPDHRRQGLFTQTTELALDRFERGDVRFCFNFPNERTQAANRKLGWERVDTVPTRYRIQNAGAFLGRSDTAVGRLADLAGRGYLAATRVRRGRSPRVSVEREPGVPAARLAEAYERRTPARIHAHRTAAFYRWRFANPAWEYATYRCPGPEGEEVLLVVGTRVVDGVRLAKLTEAVPPVPRGDGRAFRALLAAAVEDTDADAFAATGPAFRRGRLSGWGFLRDDRPPLSVASRPTVMMARPVGSAAWTVAGRDLRDRDSWHLSFVEQDTS